MKIMMSAGEVSGDMHAAAVAKEIKKINPEFSEWAEFVCKKPAYELFMI